jgi:DNA-binding transcriptional ArsR family regulator
VAHLDLQSRYGLAEGLDIIIINSDNAGMIKNNTDLILHPLRLRILRTLAGKKMTIKELNAELEDIPQASLYRHINKLVEARIITICGQNKIKGTLEKVYSFSNLSSLVKSEDLKKATKEDHFRFFASFICTLLDDYSRYLTSGDVDLERDFVGYRTVQINVTDKEFLQLGHDINEAFIPYLNNKPKAGRKLKNFSTIVVPDINKAKGD